MASLSPFGCLRAMFAAMSARTTRRAQRRPVGGECRLRGHGSRPSRLRVEGLERRAMLASNVLAYVEAGDLFVVGSVEAEAVEIVREEVTGRWTVNAGFDTTINGGAVGNSVTIDGVFDDVRIYGRGGDDVVRVVGRPLSATNDINGDFILRDTGGSNDIEVVSLQVGDNAYAITRDGDDNLLFEDFDVAGTLTVATTTGRDTIAFLAADNGGVSEVGEDATIHAGFGFYNDTIDVRALRVTDEVFFRSERATNQFFIDGLVANRIAVFGGAEDDTFRLGTRSSGGFESNQFRLYGFTGDDLVTINNSHTFYHARIFGYEDDDFFRFDNVLIDGNLVLDAAEGNDFAQFSDTRVGSTIALDGGPGNDDLNIGLGVTYAVADVQNWET